METILAVLFYTCLLLAYANVYYRLWKLKQQLITHGLPAPKLGPNIFIFSYISMAIKEGKNKRIKDLSYAGKLAATSFALFLLPIVIAMAIIIRNG